MKRPYYQFPFNPQSIIDGHPHPKWKPLEKEAAIQDYVYLILITRQREYRANKQFGCGIWESELEIPKNVEVSTWINRLKRTTQESLQNETRLTDIKVAIEMEPIAEAKPDDYKKVDIVITGYMPNLQRDFEFRRTMIFSPLSFR